MLNKSNGVPIESIDEANLALFGVIKLFLIAYTKIEPFTPRSL